MFLDWRVINLEGSQGRSLSVLFSPAIFSRAVSFSSEAHCLPAEHPTVKQFVPEWLEWGAHEVGGACLGDAGGLEGFLPCSWQSGTGPLGGEGYYVFLCVCAAIGSCCMVNLASESDSPFLCSIGELLS